MNIIKSVKEKLVETTANILTQSLSEELRSNKYTSYAIFLSGGSLKDVYANKDLQEFLKKYRKKIDIYLVDERYTNELSKDSLNDIGIRESGIQKCVRRYVPIIDSLKINGLLPIGKYTLKYSNILKKVLNDSNVYKIGLMGVGGDFHTCGIFPNIKEIFESKFNSEDLITYHDFGKEPLKSRITITMKSLSKFNEFIIFLKGEEKKLVLNYLENSEIYPLNERPCGVYKDKKTTVITDITL